MKIKAIIFGSSGMIGKGLLRECLRNPKIESLLTINRKPCHLHYTILKEIIHEDFFDLSSIKKDLEGYNTCFFCLGVSSVGLSENDYTNITYNLTIYIAETLLKINKEMTFCYISAAGADSSEKGRIMWARVKGKTENALLKMPFTKAYMFRPSYIQPMIGIKSKTKLYNNIYSITKPFYFILRCFKSFVTNSEALSSAMINAAAKGYKKNILESSDINKIADKL